MKSVRLNEYRYLLKDTMTHKIHRIDNIVGLKKTVRVISQNPGKLGLEGTQRSVLRESFDSLSGYDKETNTYSKATPIGKALLKMESSGILLKAIKVVSETRKVKAYKIIDRKKIKGCESIE